MAIIGYKAFDTKCHSSAYSWAYNGNSNYAFISLCVWYFWSFEVTYTHDSFNSNFPALTALAGVFSKVSREIFWRMLEQDFFYRLDALPELDALPDAQPTASQHWGTSFNNSTIWFNFYTNIWTWIWIWIWKSVFNHVHAGHILVDFNYWESLSLPPSVLSCSFLSFPYLLPSPSHPSPISPVASSP